jgi:hypothetical protein
MTVVKKRAKHPNRIPFAGVLTRLGLPSDTAPQGARLHRMLLTHAAAADALDSLLGMAVNFHDNWIDHNVRQKCGVITHAYTLGDELRVEGYIFAKDFPEVAEALANPKVKLGMSYNMVDVVVKDMRTEIWEITSCIFTGAAFLLQDKAAYKTTLATLQASTDRSKKIQGMLTFISHGELTVVNKLKP